MPARVRDADGLHLNPMSVGVFHDRGRGIKTHRLVVKQTCIKLGSPMHFQVGTGICQNGETDRV